jgi:CBS-domain-containing membrane protein
MEITEPSTLPVREIMTERVVTTTPDRSIDEVARQLRDRAFSGMPVVDGGGALVGMISAYDVISKRGRTVAEVMSRGVVSASEDADAEQVAGLMGLHGIRRVPLVRDGRLVGIVTRADLLRLFTTVRWVCATCGTAERGFARPARCAECGGTSFRLERET